MFEKKVAEYTTGAPEGSKRKSRGKISSVANWIEWVKRDRPTDRPRRRRRRMCSCKAYALDYRAKKECRNPDGLFIDKVGYSTVQKA